MVRLPRGAAPVALATLLLLVGCAREKPAPEPTAAPVLRLQPVSIDSLPGFERDSVAEALPALLASCAKYDSGEPSAPVGNNGIAGSVGRWRNACAAIRAGGAAGLRSVLRTRFDAFRVEDASRGDNPSGGLFTGYNEPELRGSLTQAGRFQTPIYGRPNDLITVDLGRFRDDRKGERLAGRIEKGALVPYDDRAQIARGSLAGRAPVLAWVDDPVAAFVLEIQGSGRVVLPDGKTLFIGYAAGNGRPYLAIGKTLVARGVLTQDEVSMPAIRAWLAKNPAEVRGVLDTNPSAVFFRVSDKPATGSAGVPLTPGRSLAVDRSQIPLDVPLWLDAEDPRDAGRRLQRLVVAQDTGGAIKGAVRGDLFWGPGADAERAAGLMKSKGGYYLLVPKAGPAS